MSVSSLMLRVSVLKLAVIWVIGGVTACAPTAERGMRSARPKEFFDLQKLKQETSPGACSEQTRENCHDDMKKIMAERDQLRVRLAGLQTSEDELKKRIGEVRAQAEAAISSSDVRRTVLEDKIKELESQLQKIQSEKAECAASSAQKEAELAEAIAKLAAIRSELGEGGDLQAVISNSLSSDQVQGYLTKITELEAKIAGLTRELETAGRDEAAVGDQIARSRAELNQVRVALCSAIPSHEYCTPSISSGVGTADVNQSPGEVVTGGSDTTDQTEVAVADSEAAAEACGFELRNSADLFKIVFPGISLYRELKSNVVDGKTQYRVHFEAEIAMRSTEKCDPFPLKLALPESQGTNQLGVIPLSEIRSQNPVMPLLPVKLKNQESGFNEFVARTVIVAIDCLDIYCTRVEMTLAYTPQASLSGETLKSYFYRMIFKVTSNAKPGSNRIEMSVESASTATSESQAQIEVTPTTDESLAGIVAEFGNFEEAPQAATGSATAEGGAPTAVPQGGAASEEAPPKKDGDDGQKDGEDSTTIDGHWTVPA